MTRFRWPGSAVPLPAAQMESSTTGPPSPLRSTSATARIRLFDDDHAAAAAGTGHHGP